MKLELIIALTLKRAAYLKTWRDFSWVVIREMTHKMTRLWRKDWQQQKIFNIYPDDTFRPFDKRACSKNASRLKNSIWMTCQNEFLLHATHNEKSVLEELKFWFYSIKHSALENGTSYTWLCPIKWFLSEPLFKFLLGECLFYWCYQFFLKTTHYLSTKYFHLKPFFTGHEKIFEGWIGL